MVRLRREFSRTLVEPLIWDFDIHLTLGPASAGLKLGFRQVLNWDLLAKAFQNFIHVFSPSWSYHQLHDCFVWIFGSYDGHSLIGLDDEFEVGNILPPEPQIS